MIFKLKPGTDQEEFWKHWQNVHAAQYKKMPYLQKYVLNRVMEVIKGEPVFWGLVETWWKSKEEHAMLEQTAEAKAFSDPYFREHIQDSFSAWMEEKQMKQIQKDYNMNWG